MKTLQIINQEKNTVVTLLKTKIGDFRGIAKRNPSDPWSETVGKIISGFRAQISYLKNRKYRLNKKASSLRKEADYLEGLASEINKEIDAQSTILEQALSMTKTSGALE